VENVEHPAQYVDAVLHRTQTRHIERTYDIKLADYDNDAVEFLSILARKGGRLLRGGEPDVDGVAKMVLNDFLRGKIPWFTPPPRKEGTESAETDATTQTVEGRQGRLGEMPGKRKIADAESEVTDENLDDAVSSASDDEEEDEVPKVDDEFEDFDDDNDDTNDTENEGDGPSGAEL
jgi:nuclear GTP-binding protein